MLCQIDGSEGLHEAVLLRVAMAVSVCLAQEPAIEGGADPVCARVVVLEYPHGDLRRRGALALVRRIVLREPILAHKG